jgi:hypothetical protein
MIMMWRQPTVPDTERGQNEENARLKQVVPDRSPDNKIVHDVLA